MKYKHTQIGYLVISVVTTLFLFLFLIESGREKLIVFLGLLLVLLLVSLLTVKIDEQFVYIKFGIGLINKKFKINEIESCHIVKNHWYNGWGIRLIPGGWLYNVSGYMAVELIMKNGKKYRIGTDEPENLQVSITRLIK